MSGKSRRSRKRSSATSATTPPTPNRSPTDAPAAGAEASPSRAQSDENTDELFARTSGELVRFAREKRRAQRHWQRPAMVIGFVTVALLAGLLLCWMGLGQQ